VIIISQLDKHSDAIHVKGNGQLILFLLFVPFAIAWY